MKNTIITLLAVLLVSCGSLKNMTIDDKQHIAELAVQDLGLSVEVEIVDLDTRRIYVQPNSQLKALVGMSGKNKYRIKLLKELTTSEVIEVLCHEVWHIKQYQSGDFKVLSYKDAMFKGKLIRHYQEMPYEKRPWEKEAFIEGRRLAWRIKQQLKQ